MTADSRDPAFLIVALRYLGDVLFSTALAASIKHQIPSAHIDFLVFKGAELILAKNPHVRHAHTISSGFSGWKTFARLWKRYDTAIGINSSDRTTICAFGGGRTSVGFTGLSAGEWWKKRLLTHCRPFDTRGHMLPLMTSQLQPLGIAPIQRPTVAWDQEDTAFVASQLGPRPFVLLHPYSRQPYKYWPAAAWAQLAQRIRTETGLRPIFTRTGSAADAGQFNAIRGRASDRLETFPEPFSFTQLAAAIRTCRLFVGVDTVATHMAAALDSPLIGLYGPTRTRNWGPWPNDWPTATPYQPNGAIQRRGRITVMQLDWPCTPCGLDTCAITSRGKIECLESLSVEMVLDAIKTALPNRPAA